MKNLGIPFVSVELYLSRNGIRNPIRRLVSAVIMEVTLSEIFHNNPHTSSICLSDLPTVNFFLEKIPFGIAPFT